MVRVKSEGRSKGCQACRKRKIKCDKVSPTCSYCARTGKQCSGASTGLVFLHAKPEAGFSKTKRLLHERDDATGSRDLARRPKAPDAVIGPQVDSPKARTIQFINGWISAYKGHDLPFMVALKTLRDTTFSTPDSDTYEKLILAVMLAFDSVHSKSSDNKIVLMEAYKFYGFGLNIQRRQLGAFAHNPEQKPTVGQICMPVLLGYFEILRGSDHRAFVNHWKAAINLIEMAGPEAFQEDNLHRIFQVGRLQMVYLSLRQRKPYIFGAEKWRVIPFEGRVKTAVDRTADVFVQLPGLLAQLDLRNAGPDNNANFELERKASILKTQLDWIKTGGRKHVVKRYNTEPPNSTHIEKELRETAQIIILSEIPEIRRDRHLDYHHEMIDLCASLLAQALLFTERNIGSLHMRTVFSLQVVEAYSPSVKQREEAVAILQRWKVLIGAGLMKAAIGVGLYINIPSKK